MKLSVLFSRQYVRSRNLGKNLISALLKLIVTAGWNNLVRTLMLKLSCKRNFRKTWTAKLRKPSLLLKKVTSPMRSRKN